MNKFSLLLSAVVLAFCLNACGNAKKTNVQLADKYWKLTELNGTPVEAGQSAKEPHIILDNQNLRLSGNAGCNVIAGAYQLTKPGKITFLPIAATQMMCLNMEIENQFLKVFESVEGYTIHGDVLTFIDAKRTPLARFTFVPAH